LVEGGVGVGGVAAVVEALTVVVHPVVHVAKLL